MKSHHLTRIVAAPSRNSGLGPVLEEVAEAFREEIGFLLFSITTIDQRLSQPVRRLWSNHPQIYPVGGAKELASDHWSRMRATRPGVREFEVVARLEAIMRAHDLHPAYPAILTRRREILHNLRYDNKLEAGDLVVNDCGVSSPHGYPRRASRLRPQ